VPPSVSVVIPSYNCASYVSETIRSVLAQSLRPTEIIVVDDGSSDDTPSVARGFPEGVRYIRQENAGAGAARNAGVEASTGEWIAFLDADDIWHADKLRFQLCAHEAFPACRWSITECSLIDMDGNSFDPGSGFEKSFPVFREEAVDVETYFGRWLTGDSADCEGNTVSLFHGDLFEALFLGNVALPSSSLVHRSLIEKAGGFNPAFRLGEDTEFFHRIAAHSDVLVLTAPLVSYRRNRPGSNIATWNKPDLTRSALLSLQQASKLRPLSDKGKSLLRLGRQRLYLWLAYTLLSDQRTGEVRSVIREEWSGDLRGARMRSAALYMTSLLPPWSLQLLRRIKRTLR
jgi:glycosyltransferase involved in cell wall biosynthesis